MKLSIITINFRKPHLTLACVESVYKAYRLQFEKNEYELLIVDNFSENDSVAALEQEVKKKKYRNVSIVANTVNSGFGGGNNFGAKRAKGDYVLFLNNDTIVKKGIDRMLSFFDKHSTIGILGGVLKNLDGSSQASSGKFYLLPQVFLLLLGIQRFEFIDKNPTRIAKVDWVKGALLMIRRDLFEEIHGFDEKIFMYTEDMELCYRVHLLGKEIWMYPDVEVLHADQGSSSRGFAIINIYKGLLYFYKKHRSALEYFLVKFLLQSKATFLLLYGKLVRNEYLVTTYEKALNAC